MTGTGAGRALPADYRECPARAPPGMTVRSRMAGAAQGPVIGCHVERPGVSGRGRHPQ